MLLFIIDFYNKQDQFLESSLFNAATLSENAISYNSDNFFQVLVENISFLFLELKTIAIKAIEHKQIEFLQIMQSLKSTFPNDGIFYIHTVKIPSNDKVFKLKLIF